MKKIGVILKNYDPKTDKYISREFQAYGIYLAEELNDYKHKSLYIKLAKNHPRALLEKVYSFVIDSNAKNKGALFMWKLTQLKAGNPTQSSRSPSGTVRTRLTERLGGAGTTNTTNATNTTNFKSKKY